MQAFRLPDRLATFEKLLIATMHRLAAGIGTPPPGSD
jgi:hypothetical protein